MGSLKYYFTIPFLPHKILPEFIEGNHSGRIYWLVLPVHLVLFCLLTVFVDYKAFQSWLNPAFFVFGFILGFLGRFFFLAYILWISMSRIFQKKVSYAFCINSVFVTLLPVSLGALLSAVAGFDYGIFRWLGVLYGFVLIAWTFTLYKNVDFSRMLVLVIVSHFILWVMAAPFMGIPL